MALSLGVALGAALGASVALPGCVLSRFDYDGRRCPCVAGWVCDTARDECVPSELAVDAGSPAPAQPRVDAAIDPGLIELGPVTGLDGLILHDAGVPPVLGCDPDAVFCEDFESGDLSRWDTVSAPPGATVALSLSPRSGAYALTVATVGPEVRIAAPLVLGTATEVHFRAWVRVRRGTVGPIQAFDLRASGAGSIAMELVPAARSLLGRVAASGTTGVSSEGRAGSWTEERWFCVRATVARAAIDGRFEIFEATRLDAVVEGVSTDFGVPYDRFALVLGTSGTGSAIDVDDVAWSLTPLACE